MRTVVTPADIATIHRMPLFSRMSEADLRTLIGGLEIIDVPTGAVMFRRGDHADRFFGVLSGWISVFNVDADGNETVLGLFSRGDTFAEAALFMDAGYPATSQAVAPSRLMVFDSAFFETRVLGDEHLMRCFLASTERLGALVRCE